MRPIFVSTFWIATLAAAFFAGKWIQPSVPPPQVSERIIVVTNEVAAAPNRENLETEKNLAAENLARAAREAAATNIVAFAAPTSAVARADFASSAEALAVLRIKDPALRARAFARLLDGITANNAKDIFQTFLSKGWDSPRAEEQIRMIAENWAAVDGKGAADFIASIPHDERPQNSLRATLTEWAMRDLDGAEAWAKAETTNQPNPYMIGVIAGAANVDIARAENMLYAMPFGRERGDAMAYVVGAHLQNGEADAMNWALSVPDPRLEQAAIRRVASQVAIQNPAQAAAWVLQNSNKDSLQNNVSEIARQWSDQAPADAVNWAFALPAGPARDAAISSSLPALAQQDPATVEKLLANQQPTQVTDSARMRLAKDYSGNDPIRAIAWANTVTDPHARDHMTQHIIANWQQRDPQAAAQFLQPKTR